MTEPKKPRRAKPPAGKKPQKRTRAAARKTARQEPPAPEKAPAGPRLRAAQQAQRDSLMIARLIQDWPWDAIAAEAGISVAAAKRAVQERRKTPLKLRMDPMEVLETTAEGYQLSIGDYEAMSSAAMEDRNISAAVGAKRSANEAREKMLVILQWTGRLPQDMADLRHLLDLRAVTQRMMDVVEQFELEAGKIAALKTVKQREAATRDAARRVTGEFRHLLELEPEPSVRGTAEELPPGE